MFLHREHRVQAGGDLRGVAEIDAGQGAAAQHVGDIGRMHGRADAMAGHVQHEAHEGVVVEELVAERIAAELREGTNHHSACTGPAVIGCGRIART